ncbi:MULTISPECIES: glycosyltransferase family 2 protein [unclassified Brucella]|uniref:glycosyltransferase family 2 protein n=1 Tax=unclassified Brucella TaxID=2632610 RepID=UPI000972A7DD|nr:MULTISPECIES: glycosyltransferase family 2 protein [unclassified Brucella]APX70515.1 glycosyltransferase [Brucella sp. 09RB8471]MRN79353.1 glycosyltransferase [Brucella sp. 10RB9210]
MNIDNYRLDVVIPCYNEDEALPNTIPQLATFLDSLINIDDIGINEYRLILVDDGSSDQTWQLIEGLSKKIPALGIKLSRNYGHQNAMLAGLSVADADVILTIDADLQDDLNAITLMLRAYQNGSELALGVRSSRDSDTSFKRNTAKGYYKLLSLLGASVIEDHADFRLMSQKALRVLLSHEETNLFLRGIIPTIGFKTELVYYSRQDREFGETKYTLRKMLSLALNGITSFSIVPLRIVTALGASVSFLSFIACLWAIGVLLFGHAVPGWASTLLPILLLGGVQLLCLGVVGEYIGKIYMEVKKRPRFIIDRRTEG